MSRFTNSPDRRIEAIIAWGTQGFSEIHDPQSSMPAYYFKYSLREVRELADHIQSLKAFPYPYTVFGVTPGYGIPDVPDAGHSDAGGHSPEGGHH
jgi:hypothetical protein